MKLFFRTSITILLAVAYRQTPNAIAQTTLKIEWQTTFGGSQADAAYAMLQTPEGGYVVVGYSASNDGEVQGHHGTTTTRDILVLRLDSTGNVLWQRSLGGSSQEYGSSLCFAHGGGYLIAGGAESNDGDVTGHHGAVGVMDCWIVKLDDAGHTLWSRCYGGTLNDDILRIVQTDDGGYLFAARSYSNDGDVTGHHGPTTTSDYWVVKIDSIGNIQWEKSYGGTGDDAPFALCRTDDNAFVLAGDCSSNDGDVTGNHGGSDIWALKINDTGKVLWENSFGGPGNEDMNSVTLASDGGYIVGGSAYYSGGDITTPHNGHNDEYDIWVFKLSRDGKLVWNKSLGGTGRDYEQDVHATPDGGCLVSGYTTSNDLDVSGHHGDTTNYDGWLVKLDSNSNLLWQKCIGGTLEDGASGIIDTRDGGCIVAANTSSNNGDVTVHHGGMDAWIVKLAPQSQESGVESNPIQTSSFSIFPNPASSIVHLNLVGVPYRLHSHLEICDVLGRIIISKTVSDNEQRSGDYALDITSLPEGTYAVRLTNADEGFSPLRLLTVVRRSPRAVAN